MYFAGVLFSIHLPIFFWLFISPTCHYSFLGALPQSPSLCSPTQNRHRDIDSAFALVLHGCPQATLVCSGLGQELIFVLGNSPAMKKFPSSPEKISFSLILPEAYVRKQRGKWSPLSALSISKDWIGIWCPFSRTGGDFSCVSQVVWGKAGLSVAFKCSVKYPFDKKRFGKGYFLRMPDLLFVIKI